MSSYFLSLILNLFYGWISPPQKSVNFYQAERCCAPDGSTLLTWFYSAGIYSRNYILWLQFVISYTCSKSAHGWFLTLSLIKSQNRDQAPIKGRVTSCRLVTYVIYRRDGDRWEWNMVKWWLGREDWSTTLFHSTWTRFLLNSGLLRVILLSRILILGSKEKQRTVYCRVGARNLRGWRPLLRENDG